MFRSRFTGGNCELEVTDCDFKIWIHRETRMAKKSALALVPVEQIERQIYVVRGERLMLDEELAELYGVPTKVLNQAVKRNAERFPEEFAFRLTQKEFTN